MDFKNYGFYFCLRWVFRNTILSDMECWGHKLSFFSRPDTQIAWVDAFSHKDCPLRNNLMNFIFTVKTVVFTKPGKALLWVLQLPDCTCTEWHVCVRACIQVCMRSMWIWLTVSLSGYASEPLEATFVAHWQCSVSWRMFSALPYSWLHHVLVSICPDVFTGKKKKTTTL